MDPLGFALENYDAIGRWRTVSDGVPVDSSASLPDGTTFEGVAGLRDLLEDRQELFVDVFTERLLTYALGRELEYFDLPVIRDIKRKAAGDDYRWSSIISGIVQSQPFQMSVVEDANSEEAAARLPDERRQGGTQ
jgi:hypothetical protein